MPLPFSRSKLDKLGKRLAVGPTEEDFLLLQEVRAAYDEALAEVWTVLESMGLDPVSRLKTVQSIVEKLAREKGMGLKGMQDIAGIRVVVDGTRRDQDAVVRDLERRFGDCKPKVVDRRETPTYGYRAVHLIVHFDGLPMEIQVRTTVQQLWAELSERLADEWGRQIRYGEPPDEPNRVITGKVTRLGICLVVIDFSQRAAELETAAAELQWILSEWDAGRLPMQEDLAAQLAESQRDVGQRLEQYRQALQGLIHAFSPPPVP